VNLLVKNSRLLILVKNFEVSIAEASIRVESAKINSELKTLAKGKIAEFGQKIKA